MDNINQLLTQAQIAHDADDWSSLTQYLQQLILGKDATYPEIAQNQEHLLELALSILEMGDFQQRWEIVKVFSHLGNFAIAPLIDILKDEDADEEVRWYAARALGEFQHPDVIAPLVELLRSVESQELKAIAAGALSQIGTPAIAALSQLLTQDDTKLLAVRSLSYIRHTETITPLLTVVQDPQSSVRAAAIEALGSFHDERVPSVLLNAVDDPSAIVRRAAVLSLGFRPDLREALDLANKLQPKLNDLNQEVACAAAIALSRIGGEDAAQQLFQVLISPQAPLEVQLEAIRALSWLGTSDSCEYLHQVFKQCTSATLWQEIVTVLGRVQKSQSTMLATEILLTILQSSHPATEIADIKSAIALSLGQLGKIEAIDPLISLLADQDTSVRLHAIAALKNLAPEVAHQKLQQLANTTLTPDLQQGIAIALAEWGR
ncbi:HEAT repeat domain-containing protein [Calothrix sp. PCC 7507]|uniref:HEAT repeat domain-containing protein n=1 Tax=Calothrix sp. PCC 7507 TaxID=99598 RepID=UPI00029F0903|nr:PBS lyase HEAT domain protein repeat-containing protein [Calothrix sp. PCC 7507]